MTFTSALTLLREGWRTLVIGVLVGLIAGTAVSAAMPNRYAATAKVYVAGIDAAPSTGSDVTASVLLVQQRSTSYRELITSDRVLNAVTERLGVPVTADRVAAVSQDYSAIFSVIVTEDDPVRAAVVATAVAERFAQVISELERPGGPGTPPTVAATVLDRAVLGVATGPSTAGNVLVGVMFGLLAAAAWVLLRGLLDGTVRSASVLRSATGSPALGVLPRFHGRRDGSAASDPGYDEAVRRVRDHLLLAEAPDPRRALVFAGVMPGEGTTTLVRHLADVLAGTSRVLVIDADLRRPALAERYGVAGVPGLADVLAGRATLRNAIRAVDGVHVLPAGTVPSDAGALLSSPRLAELLADLRGRYDWILVDGAPLVPALDAAVMARHADGVVLLCRDDVTTTTQLETAVEALGQAGARVLGSVLTMSRRGTAGAGRYGDVGGRNVRNAPPVPVGSPAACGTPDAPEAPEAPGAAESAEEPEAAGRRS